MKTTADTLTQTQVTAVALDAITRGDVDGFEIADAAWQDLEDGHRGAVAVALVVRVVNDAEAQQSN